MMKKNPWSWLTLLAITLGHTATANAFDHTYAAWNAVTKQHVHWLQDKVQSRIDYARLKQEGTVSQVTKDFSAVTQTEFDTWSKQQQMAFLINAYNAFTVELILTTYPDLHSIKDLGSLFESPWKHEFFTLLGAQRNLDWIEHDLLRAHYQDPRVHTAIVCASIGCPALNTDAYTANKLDQQLDDGMQRFLSDRTRNRYREGKLEVSSIFKWFKEDFEKGNAGFAHIEDVFARYADRMTDDPQVQAKIRAKSLRITFLDYDWSLNDVSR